jgi:hypothetical protein
VVGPSDWRIASGQSRWCRGLVFKWSRWVPTPTISYKPDGTTEPATWSHNADGPGGVDDAQDPGPPGRYRLTGRLSGATCPATSR